MIQEYVGFGANIAAAALNAGSQDNPMDNIDLDAAIRLIGRRMSVPAEIVRDEAGVMEYRSESDKKKQAMQDALIAEQQGLAAQAQQEASNG